MKHKIVLLIVVSIGLIAHVNLMAMDSPKNPEELPGAKYFKKTEEPTVTELVLESQDTAALGQLLIDKKIMPLNALIILVNNKPESGSQLEEKINYIINQYEQHNIHPQLTGTQYVWRLVYHYGRSKTPSLAAWVRWFIAHGPKNDNGNPILENTDDTNSAIDWAIYYDLPDVVEILLAYQQPTKKIIGYAQEQNFTKILALLPQAQTNQEIKPDLIKQMAERIDALGERQNQHEIKKIAQQTEPALLEAFVNNSFNNFSNDFLSDHKLDLMINTPNFVMIFDTIIDYIQNNNIAYNADVNAVINFINCSVSRAYNNTWNPKGFNLYKKTYTKWLRFLVGYGLKGRINSPIEQKQSRDGNYTLQNCTILDYTIALFRFIDPFMNPELAAETVTILKEYGADLQRPFTLMHHITRATDEYHTSFETTSTPYNTTSLAIIKDAYSEHPSFSHLGFTNSEPMNRALEKAINPSRYSRSGNSILKAAVASISVYAFYYWIKNRFSSTQATIADDVLINNTDADIIVTHLQKSDSEQSTSTTITPGQTAQLAQTGTLHIYRNKTEKPLIINLDTYAANRTEHYLNIGISKNWLSWLFGPLRYTIHWVDKVEESDEKTNQQ